jgi:hypothetical protein
MVIAIVRTFEWPYSARANIAFRESRPRTTSPLSIVTE